MDESRDGFDGQIGDPTDSARWLRPPSGSSGRHRGRLAWSDVLLSRFGATGHPFRFRVFHTIIYSRVRGKAHLLHQDHGVSPAETVRNVSTGFGVGDPLRAVNNEHVRVHPGGQDHVGLPSA